MTAEATPPPLPARTVAAIHPVARKPRFGLPGWLLAVIAACVLLFLLFLGGIAWFVGEGWQLFAGQARQALQEQPAVQAHIGNIQDMSVDLIATGEAPGAEEFVFRLEGDRGNGRVQATFVSVGAAREIITDGTLTLADGQRYLLEDQSASDEDPYAVPDEGPDDTDIDTVDETQQVDA